MAKKKATPGGDKKKGGRSRPGPKRAEPTPGVDSGDTAVESRVDCARCDGTGEIVCYHNEVMVDEDDPRCPDCGLKGVVNRYGEVDYHDVTCPDCGGVGTVRDECATCDEKDQDDDDDEDQDEEDEDDEDEDQDEEDDDDEDEDDLNERILRGWQSRTRANQEPMPAFIVSNSDAQILALSETLLTDPTAAHGLNGILEEQGDPRAPSVGELATVECIIPSVVPEMSESQTMGCGPWFAIVRDRDSILGWPYPGTWQARRFAEVGEGLLIQVRVQPRENTAERLRSKFEICRRGMIFALLGTTEEMVEGRKVVLSEKRNARVASVLLRHCDEPEVAVSWVLELRATDRDRFKNLTRYLRARPKFADFLLALANAVQPDWQAHILDADD